MKNIIEVKKGKIVMVDFGTNIGSVQSGVRPALIIQNDVGNKFSTTTIVVPLTKASNNKKNIPTHYELTKTSYSFLRYDSVVLGEQLLTISKEQIISELGMLNESDINKIYSRIFISIGVQNQIFASF